MKQRLTSHWGLILTAMAVMPCSGALHLVTGGTSAPLGTLGGYPMFAFPTDAGADRSTVSTVPFWNGGTMNLTTTPAELDHIGSSWATWSHGYSGAVYWTDGMVANQQVLQFPADIQAFYMYIQPNFKDSFEFMFTSGGESATLMVDGNGGAKYIGLYTDVITDSLGTLTIMDMSQGNSEGFAIGEFASNVAPPVSGIPEPGSMVALGCVLATGLTLRSRGRVAP
jgi:hypothetical protein